MDAIISPFTTVLLNMVASLLVARGILDNNNVASFVQLGNTIVAGIMTLGVAIYSIYKMVDLQKHKISSASSSSVNKISQEKADFSQKSPSSQPGLPVSQNQVSPQK